MYCHDLDSFLCFFICRRRSICVFIECSIIGIMKRLFLFFLVSVSVCISSLAQKKELAQAKTYLKSGKDFDKAETLMRKLLADSNNVCNIKVWNMLADAVRMQYEQGNEKLYLSRSLIRRRCFLHASVCFLYTKGWIA